MSFKDLYCSRCSLQFDKKSKFDKHLSIVHRERAEIKEEPMTCKSEPNLGTEKVLMVCELKFETKDCLNQQIALHHEGNRPFKCEICYYSCSGKSKLDQHLQFMKERNHSNVKFVTIAFHK